MSSEVLQILNLSPIPELSEMELSTVLEQLSGFSDHNGEVTDRNVEDILREAEELIDTSISIKTDSHNSVISHKYMQSSKKNNDSSDTDKNYDIGANKCSKQIPKSDDTAQNSKESATGILNLSFSSDCITLENGKSECTVSNRNEMDSSDIEVTPEQTPRHLTNHIQSTLVSLRECSQKIKNKKKNLPHNELPNDDELSFSPANKKTETLKSKTERSEFDTESKQPSAANEDAMTTNEKSGSKDNLQGKFNPKKGLRSLTLNESMQTLNCFERLYRGKPAQIDSKKLKKSERILNTKKTSSLKFSKTIKPSKLESIHTVKTSKGSEPLILSKKSKPYISKEFEGKYNCPGENIIDEDISFEKCLELLNEETESSTNMIDITSFNYSGFTEKMLKECTASVSALQGEVEIIKSQMKRNETSKDLAADEKPDLIQQITSQESLVQILREENSKLFKEIEDIKEQLKANVETSNASRSAEKVEMVEKLRSEVENLRRSLITAYSENNGITRLEEQFSLLKSKYDLQIGKLEYENKQLKDALASDGKSKTSERREVGIQTGEVEWRPRKMVRSVSLENCIGISKTVFQHVDAATSPLRSESLHRDKELCSVSVQCQGEWDVEDHPRAALRQFRRQENKENVCNFKRDAGKTRSLASNPALKKLSEHENQLMVTIRALHSEITVKDRDNKKFRNELEAARNQIRRLTSGLAKYKGDLTKKYCHVGTQTIGLNPKTHEAYDPAMFQVSRELEMENEELKSRLLEMEKVVDILKEKRIRDLQVLQKLHEEEIDKLASRLNTQTALTNHLHSLLTNR